MKKVILFSIIGVFIGFFLFSLVIKINKEREANIQENKLLIESKKADCFNLLFKYVTQDYVVAFETFQTGSELTTEETINVGEEIYVIGYQVNSHIILSKELFTLLQEKVQSININDPVLQHIKVDLNKSITRNIKGIEHVFEAFNMKPAQTFNEVANGVGLVKSGFVILESVITDLQSFLYNNNGLTKYLGNDVDYYNNALKRLLNFTSEIINYIPERKGQ